MYYEARENAIEKIQWPARMAGQARICDKIKELDVCQGIETAGFIFINDQHIDTSERIKEVAVLIVDENDQHWQVESLTVDWMRTFEIRAWINEHIGLSLDKAPFKRKVSLGLEAKVWFSCSCCGRGFESTIKYQRQFDRDAGYGLCKRCE